MALIECSSCGWQYSTKARSACPKCGHSIQEPAPLTSIAPPTPKPPNGPVAPVGINVNDLPCGIPALLGYLLAGSLALFGGVGTLVNIPETKADDQLGIGQAVGRLYVNIAAGYFAGATVILLLSSITDNVEKMRKWQERIDSE